MTTRFDLICLGRAAVDFYAEQTGARLEDVTSFAKYLGGCAANIAVGAARQGLRVAIITRVGNEHMGRFVCETLAAEGVDTSHVSFDQDRLTGLVVLGIKNRNTFPLIFYRENCADMALSVEEIDASFITSAKALLITGTHLSTSVVWKASRYSVECAIAAQRKVVFDIDYRPVLWGLTGRGEGEVRYVAKRSVTDRLQEIIPLCDLVVGTEEEFCIAGGFETVIDALIRLREITKAVFVVKRGPYGCSVFTDKIGKTLDDGFTVNGVNVEVLNVLGAGDAFLAGFLRGWLGGESLEQCCTYANACGALVVSRHGCSPASPTKIELDDYLARSTKIERPEQDQRLNYLHWVTTRRQSWGTLMALAFDHRTQLEHLAAECNTGTGRLIELKKMLGESVLQVSADYPGQTGCLVDYVYGQEVIAHLIGNGLWIGCPVELPGTRPLEFTAGENLALDLHSWPSGIVAKCLVFYHPDDDPVLRQKQLAKLLVLEQAAKRTGHEFLIEIIPPKDKPQANDTVYRGIEQIYEAGVRPDWWKLPSLDDENWQALGDLVSKEDPYCRGVVLLGLEAPEVVLERSFVTAARYQVCKGFAVGRSIFMEPAREWLGNKETAVSRKKFISAVTESYRRLIQIWQNARKI